MREGPGCADIRGDTFNSSTLNIELVPGVLEREPAKLPPRRIMLLKSFRATEGSIDFSAIFRETKKGWANRDAVSVCPTLCFHDDSFVPVSVSGEATAAHVSGSGNYVIENKFASKYISQGQQ